MNSSSRSSSGRKRCVALGRGQRARSGRSGAGSAAAPAACACPSLRSSCSASAKPVLGMNGNGCAGSIASGDSTGNTWRRNTSSRWARSAVGQRCRGCTGLMPSRLHLRLTARRTPPADAPSAGAHRHGSAPVARPAVSPSIDGGGVALARQLAQARDAHGVELVEVGGRDRHEAQPFQQRHARVFGLFQHPPVEAEPAELAVEEPLRRPRSPPAAARPARESRIRGNRRLMAGRSAAVSVLVMGYLSLFLDRQLSLCARPEGIQQPPACGGPPARRDFEIACNAFRKPFPRPVQPSRGSSGPPPASASTSAASPG